MASSPVHVSLENVHRRGWGSLYAALSKGRIEEEAARNLLACHPVSDDQDRVPVYAVDVTSWLRCDAEASPERGYYYHPSRHSDIYGPVRVRAWMELHPKPRRIGERYGCEKDPMVKRTVILVEVGRPPRETRKPKKLWLWWHGDGKPDLDLIWRSYCRGFSLEHAIKFLKPTLGWTSPRIRHPEQADR